MSDPTADLSLDDITFLRAVKQINEAPDEYPDEWTDGGERPATTTAVREVTGLSKDKVLYRFDSRGGGRGFCDKGLMTIFDPPITDSGYGPKSAELTDKGRRVLDAAIEKHGLAEGTGGSSGNAQQLAEFEQRLDDLEDTVEGLRGQMDTIQAELETVSQSVEEWDEGTFGAIDGEEAGKIRTVVRLFPVFNVAFEEVLGVPIEQLAENRNEITPELVEEAQESVREEGPVGERTVEGVGGGSSGGVSGSGVDRSSDRQ